MALTGSYFEHISTLSPTLSQSYVEQYPIDLPIEDPNYEKRGTEETIWVSQSIETVTEHPNCYVTLKTVALHYDPNSNRYLSVIANVFNSEEHKNNDFYNPFKEEILTLSSVTLEEISLSENITTVGYNSLKNHPSFDSMDNC